MKIVVYNSADQYALSRREIKILAGTVPKQYWANIAEFHIAYGHPKMAEPFEYDSESRICYFIMPTKNKTPETRTVAIRELLLGLARIKSNSRFFRTLKPRERQEHETFIAEWLPRCESALVASSQA